jgi:hypothetical protein
VATRSFSISLGVKCLARSQVLRADFANALSGGFLFTLRSTGRSVLNARGILHSVFTYIV